MTLRYVTVPGGRLRVTQQPCLQVSIMIILGLAQAASRLRPGASRLPKVAPQYISHSLREHPRLEQLCQHVGTEAADVRLELAYEVLGSSARLPYSLPDSLTLFVLLSS